MQLSIFTVGIPFLIPKDLVEVFKNPQLDLYTPVTQYLSEENSKDCGYDNSEDSQIL